MNMNIRVKLRYVVVASMAAVFAIRARAETVVVLPDAIVIPGASSSGGFAYQYSLTTDPSVGANAQTYVIPPNPDKTAGSGDITLNYFYAVVGPAMAAGTYVPVTITGSVTANAGGVAGESQASINYYNGGVNVENWGAGVLTVNGYSPGTNGAATLNTTYDAISSVVGALTPLEITLYVDVNAATGGMAQGESSASAGADPIISLSPDLLAEGYSIELSPNLTPVPLPSTWLMLCSGLFGIGLLAHRGTKRGSAATAAV
jgi:hypothetical protein